MNNLNNLNNCVFTTELLNIKDYLLTKSTQKQLYIELTEQSAISMPKPVIPLSISYCIIRCNEYKKTMDFLDDISNYLKNGAIILFMNWFDNIDLKGTGPRDAVYEWLNENELIEFIDFPINTWNKRAFIIRRNKIGYMNWSD